MKAVQITEFGGPEVLRVGEIPEPVAGDGETLVRVSRVGVNFADTHVTGNNYLAKQELPFIPGAEVAGTAPDGSRVAALLLRGGYAEQVSVPNEALVPIPDGVDDDQAASLLLQGLTARSLLRISADVQPGESVVVEAAAGGTGSLAVQLAKSMGARVIALASSEEKRSLALELGADVAIDSRADRIGEAILAANDGSEVDVVLQMSGGDAFEQMLRVIAPFGRMVTFGIATREQNLVKTGHLMRNSRAVVGFWVFHLFSKPVLLREGIEEVFGAAASGDLHAVISGTHPLSEASRVHEELAGRRTNGKILLDPSH